MSLFMSPCGQCGRKHGCPPWTSVEPDHVVKSMIDALTARNVALATALGEARDAVLERFYQADSGMPGSPARNYSDLLAKIDALLDAAGGMGKP